jgi:hypothetical protein
MKERSRKKRREQKKKNCFFFLLPISITKSFPKDRMKRRRITHQQAMFFFVCCMHAKANDSLFFLFISIKRKND